MIASSLSLLACGCGSAGHPMRSLGPVGDPTGARTTGSLATQVRTSPSTPGRRDTSSGTRATPATTSATQPADAANGFVPPVAGTFTYAGTDADGKAQKWRLDDAVSRDGAATKVVTALKTDDGKTAATTTTSWTPGQVLVTDIQIGDADCHWSPPSPMAVGPAVGRQWTIDSTCVVTGHGYTVHVHEKGTGTVQRRAKATVGGQARPAWWVLTAVTLTIESKTDKGELTLVDTSRNRTLLMPSVGLAAQIDQRDEWSGFGKTKTTEQHMTLQSLTPA